MSGGGEVGERAADLHPTPGEILGERAGLRGVDERGVAPGGEGEREIVHVHLASRAPGEGDVGDEDAQPVHPIPAPAMLVPTAASRLRGRASQRAAWSGAM
jgi:hypothetical protein